MGRPVIPPIAALLVGCSMFVNILRTETRYPPPYCGEWLRRPEVCFSAVDSAGQAVVGITLRCADIPEASGTSKADGKACLRRPYQQTVSRRGSLAIRPPVQSCSEVCGCRGCSEIEVMDPAGALRAFDLDREASIVTVRGSPVDRQ